MGLAANGTQPCSQRVCARAAVHAACLLDNMHSKQHLHAVLRMQTCKYAGLTTSISGSTQPALRLNGPATPLCCLQGYAQGGALHVVLHAALAMPHLVESCSSQGGGVGGEPECVLLWSLLGKRVDAIAGIWALRSITLRLLCASLWVRAACACLPDSC